MSSEMTAKRERVVRWSDPKELEAGARRMSGREFLTAIRECHFKPSTVNLCEFSVWMRSPLRKVNVWPAELTV